MDERAAKIFRQRIVESQPWFQQAQALAEIDRLASRADRDLPEVLRAAVEAMSDQGFAVFTGTVTQLLVTATKHASQADVAMATRLRAQLELVGRTAPPLATARHDPAVGAERRTIFKRYSQAAGKVAQGTANAGVIGELHEILTMQQQLQAKTAEGSPDWHDLEEQRAYVTESVARAWQILRQGPEAVKSYQEALQIWHDLGEDDQEARCTDKLAEVERLEDADIDRVRGTLVAAADRDMDPAGPAALPRAQALTSLAALHVQARDDFQARQRLSGAREWLTALGFADPVQAGLGEAFITWVRKAPGPASTWPSDQRFLRVVASVLGMWESLLNTTIALGDDHDRKIGPLIPELAAYSAEMRPQARAARAALVPTLARLGIDPFGGAGQSAETGSEVLRQLDELYQAADRLKDGLDRTETGQDAADLAREAEDDADTSFRIGQPGLGSSFSILAADAHINAGRYADAVKVLESRRSQLLDAPGFAAADKRDCSVALLTREALAVARLGDFAKLSQVCGAGIADVELDRHKVSAPHMQDTYLRDRINLYRMGVFAEWKLYADTPTDAESPQRRHIETMLERAELSKAHSGLGWLSWPESDQVGGQHSPESPAANGQPPSAVKQANSQLSLPAARARFDELTNDPVDEPEVTAARRRAIWDELMAAQSRARRPASTWPVFRLAAVQSTLDEDEAVLSYYWLNVQTLLVFGLDRDIARVARVPLDQAARGRLDRLVSRSLQTPKEGFATEFAKATAPLLPAELGPLLVGKRRILLSPHRVLHQLPLQAMPWNDEPLCTKLAVTIIPNLTSLLLRHQSARRALLAVGIARPAGQAEALPSAPADARDIAELYRTAGHPAAILVDAEATRAGLAELASGNPAASEAGLACLHIATHGTSPLSSTPMEASLALADGPADGLDIARWPLAADLVVLAACSSGQQAIWDRDQAGELIGDEMLGLPAAFLAAGAHQVIGTLWRVRDDVAHRMTIRLHQELLAGQATETALYRAVLGEREAALAERETGEGIADWGAFQLIAVGRAETTPGAAR
jgi:hypothetical protein